MSASSALNQRLRLKQGSSIFDIDDFEQSLESEWHEKE
jgi:hypothetical protein